MGCALLKAQLREPLTCLELETAWALAERPPEVSGFPAPPPLSPLALPSAAAAGLREETGAPGPPWDPQSRLQREAASTRPRLSAGLLPLRFLVATRVSSGRGRGRCPLPGHPQPFLHPYFSAFGG